MQSRYFFLFSILLVFACSHQDEDRGQSANNSIPPDAVATWDHDGLSLFEIEERVPEQRSPACRQMRRSIGGGGLEDLVSCYREVAEGLALERAVIAQIGDLEGAIEEVLTENTGLHRRAMVESFHKQNRDKLEEPSEAELEAFYLAHAEDFRRPGRLVLRNIFRRHDDPDNPEVTIAYLLQLKARTEAGENFGSLARRYSQSETRSREGMVGQLKEGTLPPLLEEIAFSLDDGEVSEPIRVKGGAVLLQVRSVEEGSQLPLDDVRPQVRGRLLAERSQELFETKIEGQEPPHGSVVVERADLLEALDGEPSGTVLEIADESLSVEQMRRLGGLRTVDRVADLTGEEQEYLVEVYEQQVDSQLFYLALLNSNDSSDAELLDQADIVVRDEAVAELVERRLNEDVAADIAQSPERLKAYFNDNKGLFQTPLRFDLSVWDVPFDDNPPRQLATMEELRGALIRGEMDLAEAVDEIGGSVVDLGWRTLDELPRDLPSKARSLLLQTEVGSYSDAFQQDDALHLLWVRDREDPRQLEIDEAEILVRERYIERFETQLYTDAVGRLLKAADYQFHENTLRRLLGDEG